MNGRTMSVASVTVWCGKFTDGDSAARIWLVSVVPCCWMSSAVYTSTGTASSSAAVCRAREPMTTLIGANSTAERLIVMSCSTTSPPATVTPIVVWV